MWIRKRCHATTVAVHIRHRSSCCIRQRCYGTVHHSRSGFHCSRHVLKECSAVERGPLSPASSLCLNDPHHLSVGGRVRPVVLSKQVFLPVVVDLPHAQIRTPMRI